MNQPSFVLSQSAKAQRIRANREAAKRSQKEKMDTRNRVVVRPSIVRSKLTDRERAVLRDQTDRLFVDGIIDLRFMGVRFLELHSQRWTPPHLSRDPSVACMDPEDRAEWTDEQFTAVWSWWHGLHPETRDILVELSRDVGIS